MGRITGMDYLNGPSSIICALEYFLCISLGQSGIELPKKAIISKFEKHAVYEPQNLSPYLAVTGI